MAVMRTHPHPSGDPSMSQSVIDTSILGALCQNVFNVHWKYVGSGGFSVSVSAPDLFAASRVNVNCFPGAESSSASSRFLLVGGTPNLWFQKRPTPESCSPARLLQWIPHWGEKEIQHKYTRSCLYKGWLAPRSFKSCRERLSRASPLPAGCLEGTLCLPFGYQERNTHLSDSASHGLAAHQKLGNIHWF